MDTVQFEELKNLLLEIASLQKESTPPRTSYVVKKKGQLFQVDELRVTEDIPKDVNPKEYAVTEALDLLEKAKVIEPAFSGVNNTNVPFAQTPAMPTVRAQIVNNLCSICGQPAKVSKKGNQYCACWYKDA